jgi:hypothetical protein
VEWDAFGEGNPLDLSIVGMAGEKEITKAAFRVQLLSWNVAYRKSCDAQVDQDLTGG